MSNNLPVPFGSQAVNPITPIVDPLAVEASPLTRIQARRLTDKVIKADENLWSLLVETHEKKAYAALGFHTWEEYAKQELGRSRKSAYRFLNHAKVALAITARVSDLTHSIASDLPTLEIEAPKMTHEEVDVLHKDLTAATDEIAEAVAAGATPAEAVKDAVAKRRQPTPAEVPDPDVSEIVLDPDGLDTPGGQPPPRPRLRDLPDQTPPPPRPITSPGMIGPKRQGPTCIRCHGTGVEPVRAHTATVRHGAERPAPKDCAHPLTMRLGKGCGLCLKDPV